MTMLSPISPEAYTKIGLKMFGSTCDLRMHAVLAPLRRAASMYSRTMTRRVAASATREIGAMNTMLIASTEFVTPGPSDAEIAIASMIAGNA
jgi:hypothetical protein